MAGNALRLVISISASADSARPSNKYNSPAWAGKFLDEWCRQTMRSRIEPMKKIARSLRQHWELIPNYFRAHKLISSGVVEGL
jgi:transposase